MMSGRQLSAAGDDAVEDDLAHPCEALAELPEIVDLVVQHLLDQIGPLSSQLREHGAPVEPRSRVDDRQAGVGGGQERVPCGDDEHRMPCGAQRPRQGRHRKQVPDSRI
jgi:hypothetical protein